MLQITGNEIRLTRGDNAEITVDLTDNTGEIYEIEETDELTLSVKKYIYSEEYSLKKTVSGTNVIEILPEDTKGLSYGKYYYDIELKTETGRIYTVIPVSDFKICEEITL